MKVYQITETLDIRKTKDGKFKVVDLDSKGTLQTFDNAGDAEEFRDKKRAELKKNKKPPVQKDPVQKKEPPVQKKSTVDNKDSTKKTDTPTKKTDTPTKTDIDTGGRKEPYINKDAKIDTKDIDGRKEPKITDPNKTDVDKDKPKTDVDKDKPKIKKGGFGAFDKGTPTKDMLRGTQFSQFGLPKEWGFTPGQLRQLSRTGRVTYKGKTYTKKQVMSATNAAKKAAAAAKKDQKLYGKIKGIASNMAKNTLKYFTYPGLGAAINTFWNAAQLEDIFDAYLREIQRHAKSLPDDAARNDFRKYFVNGQGKLPREVGTAYLRCVEQIVDFVLEFFIALAVGGVVLWKLVAIASVFAGPGAPIFWLVSLIVGAAATLGGTIIIEKAIDAIGLKDSLEDWAADVLLTPKFVAAAAVKVDAEQELFALTLDGADKFLIPGEWDLGDYVRDEVKEDTQKAGIPQKLSPSQMKSNLLNLIKSDPQAQEAFLAGKDQAKAAILKAKKKMKDTDDA
jgi:hypothetical protein